MKNGKFVISLDFELLWGIFDKVDLEERRTYFHNTREVIPAILNLFRQYGISCTWATVGMLFNRNWSEWEQNVPEPRPTYQNTNLNPYDFGKDIQGLDSENLCFAPELIQEIHGTPGQEIATHTYSHYYCGEKGQTPKAFRADLKRAIALADSYGITLQSLVFPRNQLNEDYLLICGELGIKTVRSNPSNWYWKETEESSLLKKIFRTGDAYVGLKDKSYGMAALRKVPGSPLEQKASRLLRPHSGRRLLDSLRLRRIQEEMSEAARNKKIYHLWWHPHNFGTYPERCMWELKKLLEHYKHLRTRYGFESSNMGRIAGELEDLEFLKESEGNPKL